MKRLSFLFLLLYISAQLVAQKAIINLPADSTLISLMQRNKILAAGIGVIENGKIKKMKVLGELKKGIPATQNTIFQIASLTKPIVEMATLRLVSKGLWQLDEPLYHYWTDPQVANDKRSKLITTRDVITHQTGFINWRWLHPTGRLTFDFDPGTKTQYSGEGLEYLKKALEAKFKMPLEKIVSKYLFVPDGMKDTHFFWDDSTLEKRYAVAHNKDEQPYEIRKTNEASAADLLMTTINDYTVFGLNVLKKKGIKEKVWKDMIRLQSKEQGAKFGLGWEILNGFSNGEFALLHSGSDPGVRTIIILLPKSKRGLIVFTNSDNGMALIKDIISNSLDIGNELIDKAK